MDKPVVLLEYEKKRVDIDRKTLNKLIELNNKFIDFEAGGKKQFLSIIPETDGWSIKAKNWVGLVKVEDFTLEILPKLTYKNEYGEVEKAEEEKKKIVRNLVKMLQIAWNIPIREVETAPLRAEINSVFEAVLAIYSAKLLDMLKEGLYKEYVQVEDKRKYVKGQIRFEEYAKRWERRHIIPIRYNDRTPDNLLNRTLKYAAYLGSLYTKDSNNFRRLKNIVGIMDDVSLAPVNPAVAGSITFNRLNESYKPLVNLASIIISNLSPEYTTGRRDVFAFLIPMERVFEKFIANVIRDHIGSLLPECRNQHVWIQGARKIRPLLNEGLFKLIPDIYIECGGRKYIIDTKYKILNKEERNYGISPADAYQMYAYASVYETDAIMLLYPKPLADIETKEWVFNSPKNSRLVVAAVEVGAGIDLISDFEDFLKNLRKILSEFER